MKNMDIPLHLRGESLFLDDMPHPEGLLHAVVFSSPLAHGKIKHLDTTGALTSPGVVAVFTAKDIPGENQIGQIILDEHLLADHEVHFIGDPIALVIAHSKLAARQALKKIVLEIEPLPVITDPRDAFVQGKLVIPPRTFAMGDVDKTWSECDLIVFGRADSDGQEHFYMESQAALAIPTENNSLKVYSSTQSPTGVQRVIARVLGLPMHQVEVDVCRLGGGFGGKEDQATSWAVMAALAAWQLKKPVKLILNRHEDMLMTGKRHPYSSDYKLGLKADGTILAYEVTYYQNAGAAADLSTAILERTLFHSTNTYYIPHVRATAASCYTHLTPFTAFRGFGGPQAMFVLECAIHQAAVKLNMRPSDIQYKNLLKEKDFFPYGQQTEHCHAHRCWDETAQRYDLESWFKRAETFNATHRLFKKGIAVMPICFGISFTNTGLNQAGALVHVYTDGSVSISTAAIEMGQGVNSKIQQIAARVFSIPIERIKIETTNTRRVANTSPTAASSGADLNGKATEIACLQIVERLIKVAAQQLGVTETTTISLHEGWIFQGNQKTALNWEKLVSVAYWQRVQLSAQGFYATPGIGFDRTVEKGNPFAYHVYGTSVFEVTLDCLRGTYVIDRVAIGHDGGTNLFPLVDQGQVEGGLLQGIGWMTMEELTYAASGKLLTDSTSTYKIPDIQSTPAQMELFFLTQADNPYAVMGSKAIGEPPFMYGIGAYFAIVEAIRACRPHHEVSYHAPITPEKVLEVLTT